jgi:hypothetical protein
MVYEEIELKSISVVEPLGDAYRIMKKILFQPFNMEKWFVIGFGAWLSQLAQGGGSGSGNNFNRNNVGGEIAQIQNFFYENLGVIILVGAVVLVVIMAIVATVTWLSSRGRFMFMDCVARNYGAVKWPWHEYKRQGNSLFLFRMLVGFVSMIFILVLVGAIGFVVYSFSENPTILTPAIIAVAFIALAVALLVVLSLLVVLQFTEDFIVPIMHTHRLSCTAAWKELWALIKDDNIWNFVIYHLFKFVIGLLIVLIVVAFVLATCCIGGCLMMVPYIGVVLTLPIHVFCRAYSACYLRQYGRWFDVFTEPEPVEEIVEATPYGDGNEPM